MVWLSADAAFARCGGFPAGLVPLAGVPHETPTGEPAPWKPKCSGPFCSQAPAPAPTTPVPSPESSSVRDLFFEPVCSSLGLTRGNEAGAENDLLTGWDLVSNLLRPPRG